MIPNRFLDKSSTLTLDYGAKRIVRNVGTHLPRYATSHLMGQYSITSNLKLNPYSYHLLDVSGTTSLS